MRWAVSAGVIVAIAGTARADEAVSRSGVTVHLEAPAACPTAAELAARVDAAIAGPVSPATVEVAIARRGGRFELALVIGGDRERVRRLRARECDEVVDAAALVLSLALLPAPEPEPEPEPEVDVAPEQVADLERPAPPGTEEEPPLRAERPIQRPARPISIALGAAAAVDGGTLPAIAGGVGVALSARRGDLGVHAAAIYFPTRRVVADPGMAGADISATAISARGCRRGGPLWLCLGAEMNLLAATGVGVENPERTGFVLWGLTAAARYQHAIGDRLSLAATAELVGHPARPAYFLENPHRLVHRPGWLSGRLWIAGEVVIF